MNRVFLALLTLFFATSTLSQAPSRNPPAAKNKPEECSIAGVVVKLAGSEPLKTATVQLQSVDDPAHAVSVVTDVGGRFEIKGIDPGRYRLKVRRTGFVTQEYGQKTPNDPGTQLRLAAGQNMRDLLFRMLPWGVIAGRILDEDGEPLPWAQVTALREVYAHGKRTLSPEALVPSNDLGEYRLFGLKPGRYFISAKFRPGLRVIGRGEVRDDEDDDSHPEYVPIYYPGSPDLVKAAAITVKAGEEIPALEFLLRPVTTFHIRGRVYNMVPGRRSSAGVIVQLEPRGSNLTIDSPDHQVNIENLDGSFEFARVLPGSYTLSAFWFEDGHRYQARQPIELGNADLEGANLTIAPGTPVYGRVVWDGKPTLERDELQFTISPVDSRVSFNAPVRATGNFFVFREVFDGTYGLGVSGQCKDCYIKAIHYGTNDALDNGFTVVSGTHASLEVILSSRGARVLGTVTDDDKLPMTGVWVVLVPDERHRDQSRLYQKAGTDQYGYFLLRGIAPGDYKIFCWDEVEDGAWEDPDFLKTFEDQGQKVSLEEADAKTVDVVAIKTKSSQ